MSLVFAFFLNVVINLGSAVDLNNLNPSELHISDPDIIGTYRVMTGSPITPEKFFHIQSLSKSHRWNLGNLANYLFSLHETKVYLKTQWETHSEPYFNPPAIKNHPQALPENWDSLNPSFLIDEDVVAAYRAMAGKKISRDDFLHYKQIKDKYKWSFSNLALHLLVLEEAVINLKIPHLDAMEYFPIKLTNGMIIYGYKSDLFIAQAIATSGRWEPHMEELMVKIVKPGNYVVDIGANIGYFTAIYSKLVGKNGKVFSFEPLPPLLKLLNKSHASNNWSNVAIYPYALSDKKGEVLIDISTINPGGSQLRSADYADQYNALRAGSVVSVLATTLDELLLDKIERLDYIKIDIEGSEHVALKGSMGIIRKFLPKITWEFNVNAYIQKGINPLELLNQFAKLGYKFGIVRDLAKQPDPELALKKNPLKPEEIIALVKENKAYLDIFLIPDKKMDFDTVNTTYDVTIVGPVDPADGIGNVSVGIVNCLAEEFSINWIATRQNNYPTNQLSDRLKRIINNSDKTPGCVVLFTDMPWDVQKKLSDRVPDESFIKIAYTMLETDKIPEEWVKVFNNEFDALVVPDVWHVNVYENSGVNVPIFVLPMPLDLEGFLNKPFKRRKLEGPFIFGNLSGTLVHKNQMRLIDAFARAFGNSSKVKLIMNSRVHQSVINSQIRQRIADLKLTNVVFDTKRLAQQDYIDLMYSFDCYVSLSKGEGYSIAPRESLALAIPTIITNNTAHKTICQSGLVKCVRADILERAYYGIFGKQCGNFFNCTVHDAASALKDVYEHYDTFFKKSYHGKNWALQYTSRALKKKYMNLVKPKEIILASKNRITNDALMTNSAKLYEKYRKIIEKKTNHGKNGEYKKG